MAKLKVGILISGRGSNMAALIRPPRRRLSRRDRLRGQQRRRGGRVAIARAAGIATAVIPHQDFADRESFDQAVRPSSSGMASSWSRWRASCASRARGSRALAGPADQHPSLAAAAFPGLHVQQQALDAGGAA
jgi:phosphoribosylglycinamide formyltransferase-1